MPDTKKFPQPATAPDGLANALPDVPVCDPDCHGEPDIVARLRSDLPDDEVLYDLSELFRVFGDTTRIKILYALFESELCVGDLAQLLDVSQSAVSHQLRLLKASKLVKFRRDGKTKGDIIMQKKFKIEVDCANCAAKIEDAVKKLPGVNSASVNFMAQKMVLDVDDDKFDAVLKDVVKTAKRVEPDFEIEL